MTESPEWPWLTDFWPVLYYTQTEGKVFHSNWNLTNLYVQLNFNFHDPIKNVWLAWSKCLCTRGDYLINQSGPSVWQDAGIRAEQCRLIYTGEPTCLNCMYTDIISKLNKYKTTNSTAILMPLYAPNYQNWQIQLFLVKKNRELETSVNYAYWSTVSCTFSKFFLHTNGSAQSGNKYAAGRLEQYNI